MRWVIVAVGAVYIVGAIAIFALHTQLPVTLGLALQRSALWPLWIITGRPEGEPTWTNDSSDPYAG